jgi:hypothetical protein
MYCPQCGQSLPDDAARCTACGAQIDMPLQRPGESWETWKDRVDRWIAKAEQGDSTFLSWAYANNPMMRERFERNPDFRGWDLAQVMLKHLQRARRDRAFVTLMTAERRYPLEERTTHAPKQRGELVIDRDWSSLVSPDWLQKVPDELVGWRMAYELIREHSKDGTATYEEARRAEARRVAREAARQPRGISPQPLQPPRRQEDRAMNCSGCGNQLAVNEARCLSCMTCVPLPAQRPDESVDEWDRRVVAWLEDAAYADDEWLQSQYVIYPELRTVFQRHEEFRGQDYGSVLRSELDRARRVQAMVTAARIDPMGTDEERELAKKHYAVRLLTAGPGWLQEPPDELAWAELIKAKVRDQTTLEGAGLILRIQRAVAEDAARRAGKPLPPPEPSRQRGLFDRLRGRSRT